MTAGGCRAAVLRSGPSGRVYEGDGASTAARICRRLPRARRARRALTSRCRCVLAASACRRAAGEPSRRWGAPTSRCPSVRTMRISRRRPRMPRQRTAAGRERARSRAQAKPAQPKRRSPSQAAAAGRRRCRSRVRSGPAAKPNAAPLRRAIPDNRPGSDRAALTSSASKNESAPDDPGRSTLPMNRGVRSLGRLGLDHLRLWRCRCRWRSGAASSPRGSRARDRRAGDRSRATRP